MKTKVDDLGVCGIIVEDWDITKEFKPKTITTDYSTWIGYISRRPVPANTPITNTYYWKPIFRLEQQVSVDYNAFKKTIETLVYSFIHTSESGVAFTNEFGDNEDIGINQKALTEAINNILATLALHQIEISGLDSQNYVSVSSYSSLPATGSADTIYRVSFWDGNANSGEGAADVTKYTEYAWNGTAYIVVSVKTQIGEVFDISEYKAVGGTLAKFADLSAALDSGNNVPAGIRKGGMSVKFVQSSDKKYVQYRCIADEFITDVTQWAIADEGVYVENPEFVYVKTDAEGKILFGIKVDGEPFFGVGCPEQVKEYVEEKIAELSLDEYEDIVAFINDYLGSDTTLKVMIDSINAQIATKVDKVEGKSLIDEEYAEGVYYIENPEFVEVKFDQDGKILEATRVDGTKLLPAGVEINEKIDFEGNETTIIENLEFVEVKLDGAGHILWGIQKDGNVYFGAGIPQQVVDYINEKIAELSLDEYEDIVAFLNDLEKGDKNLQTLLNEKVDKVEGKSLIDAEYASSQSIIENPEFLEVTTDSEDKVLEGIQKDGTKVIGGDLNVGGSADISGDIKVLGNMEVSGVSYKVIENPEYLAAWIDAEDKVIFGLKTDGKTYVGDADFLNNIKNNQEAISEIQATLASISSAIELLDIDTLSSITAVENPEFIEAKTDSEGKLLAGRTPDGAAFENVGFSTPKVSIDGNTIENIEDPEGRSEITTDAEGKVISYRDADGVKHEEAGIHTNSLSLTEEGLSDFEKALKDAGYAYNDFSDNELVDIPEPKNYAILNCIIDRLPIYNNIGKGYAIYYDKAGNMWKKPIELSIQGQSSVYFANNGGKGNYTLDIVDGSEIKFGSWVSQDSFHLKGSAKDITHSILATSYKWAYMMQEYLHSRPNRVLIHEEDITTTRATGDRITDWPTDARCLPDGFPCELYINGEYWGLYSWQLKKHRKNYSMDKKDYTTFFLDADDFGNFWLGEIPWTRFEIKNPKDLYCMDGSKYDGDLPKELIDDTSEYYDSSNKKHKGSKQTKDIIKSFSAKYLEVKALVETGTQESLSEAKTKFADYFDVDACILVYVYNCLMDNDDSIAKNTLWGTYSDGRIVPMLWDLDAMYGTGWTGLRAQEPTTYLWTVYARAEWPLALLWTLYQDDIKNTYKKLRREGIISMDTWRNIMYGQWVNRIGEEAFKRDSERWPETPSYRDNLTNTEYWEELSPDTSVGNLWNASTSYSQNDEVTLKLHPNVDMYMHYRAKEANTNVCPVTGFYNSFPQVGGFYDSPKRMEKWMAEQINLCDTLIGYAE